MTSRRFVIYPLIEVPFTYLQTITVASSDPSKSDIYSLRRQITVQSCFYYVTLYPPRAVFYLLICQVCKSHFIQDLGSCFDGSFYSQSRNVQINCCFPHGSTNYCKFKLVSVLRRNIPVTSSSSLQMLHSWCTWIVARVVFPFLVAMIIFRCTVFRYWSPGVHVQLIIAGMTTSWLPSLHHRILAQISLTETNFG